MKKTFVPVMFDCNDNCISCPVPRKDQRKNPSFSQLKKEIDKILKYSKHIEFNGGEPTLTKDFIKILKYAESKKPKEIFVLTNAQLFYYERSVKQIAKIKNLKIITTLYGHNSRIHNAITRTPKSFEKKIKGIQNLIKYKIPIELRILLHKMNYRYFKDIADFIITNFSSNDFEKIVIMNPKLTCAADYNKKHIMEKISKIAGVLKQPILELDKMRFRIELYHFPHCVLSQELWKYSKGITAEDNALIFPDFCVSCNKRKECSGIWRSYYDLNGDNEFKPVKNEIHKINLKKYIFHKKIFNIKNNYFLKAFEELMSKSVNSSLQCSIKIENNIIYPIRFNLWYPKRETKHINKFLNFFKKISKLKGVSLNYKMLKKIFEDIDINKIIQVIMGIDLRKNIKDSRLKIYIPFKNQPKILKKVLDLHGYNNNILNFVSFPISTTGSFAFCVDFYFDGRNKIKIYPEFRQKDLNPRTFKKLQNIFLSKVLDLIKKSKTLHVSFTKEEYHRLLHFNPIDWDLFTKELNNKYLKHFNKKIQKTNFIDRRIVLYEKEINQNKIKNINLYY